MCGIAGIVNFQKNGINPELLRAMTECIHHRGPDDDGYFSDEHVGFGFKRLSIIDLVDGHQPMVTQDKKCCIVFNGEIYNFKELREELKGLGCCFQTESDTEVVLNAYQKWGKKCVHRFNGMFALAIYDQNSQSIFLARDRLGIKPLYYAFVNGDFVFGSEMKCILHHPHFERRPNYSAISSYLTFRYPQGDQPVYDGMKRLAPGHTLEITREGHRLSKYWEIPFHKDKEDRGEKFYLKEIERLLTEAVQRRMISDVPLGALLSGGLDSSIIVALMSKLSNHRVQTFSIGFDHDEYDESKYAKLVSDYCGADHHYLRLTQADYLEGMKSMIHQKDAPLSIPHEVALNRICVELKKHITVVISGEGADELFGGYGRVQRSPMDFKKIECVNKYIPKNLREQTLRLMGAGIHAEEWTHVKNHMDYFFNVYNWMPFEEKWSLLDDNVLASLNGDETTIQRWSNDFEHVKGGDYYDQILYMFEKNHLICLLDRLDSMSMATAVEARVPFVDHELVEFVSQIPSKYKLKWKSPLHRTRALFENSFQASEKLDYSKYILRKYSTKILPKEIAFRKKLGFPVPLDHWINDGMANAAKEILLDSRATQRGLFKKDKLEYLINNRQKLDYDFWGKKIWMLMNVELWFQEFMDAKVQEPVGV